MVLKKKSKKLKVGKNILDTCGTGGDGKETLNVSTATAILTSACGIKVAKHGNRAVSSKSGSSDVLQELGVNINADLKKVKKCLDEIEGDPGPLKCYGGRSLLRAKKRPSIFRARENPRSSH